MTRRVLFIIQHRLPSNSTQIEYQNVPIKDFFPLISALMWAWRHEDGYSLSKKRGFRPVDLPLMHTKTLNSTTIDSLSWNNFYTLRVWHLILASARWVTTKQGEKSQIMRERLMDHGMDILSSLNYYHPQRYTKENGKFIFCRRSNEKKFL